MNNRSVRRSSKRAGAAVAHAVWVGSAAMCIFPAVVRAMTVTPDSSQTPNDKRYLDLAADPKYAAVGAISIGPTPQTADFASGIVISPKWVLTAAHVTQVAGPATFNVGGSAWYNGATYTSVAGAHYTNPGWPGALTMSGNDLGLILLDSPVTNVTPASRYFLPNEVGKVGTSVGYGLTGTGTTGAVAGTAGTKRAINNDIDVFGSTFGYGNGIMASDFDDPSGMLGNTFGGSLPRDLEGSIAPGDSGGGVFIEVNGRAYVAGVHSFLSSYNSSSPNGRYGDFYASTRLAYSSTGSSANQYNAWIDDYTTNAWNTNTSGSFNAASKWTLGATGSLLAPTNGDIAGFNVIGSYTVTFDGTTASNYQLLSRAGDVTLNLNGSTYNLTSASYDGAMVVGRYTGNSASVTLTGGTINSGDVIIGQLAGSIGRVIIGNNASLNVNRDVYVGGTDYGTGGSGTIAVQTASSSLKVAGTLRVLTTGTVTYSNGTLSVGTLDVAGGRVNVATGSGRVVQAKKVQFSGTGKLDLNDNDMIVDYTGSTPVVDIRNYILAGFANGLQSGNGIISTRAKTSPSGGETGKARLGYSEASALGLSSFDGIAVDSTAVLVKYTYAGDANLDGKVDISDLYRLSIAWQTSGYWSSGDFNYDGTVNAVDLSILSGNWQAGMTGALGPVVPLATVLTSLGLPLTAVPEPASFGLLAIAGVAMLRRRR